MILAVYGERVKRGEWRDYAIDTLSHIAVFSVFRASREQPAYSIMKKTARGFLKPVQYAVYAGTEILKEGVSLREVLTVFEEVSV